MNNFTTEDATPYILGKLNKETIFVLDKWNIAEPQLLDDLDGDDDVVIVDTNNPKELPSNINDTNIVKIIDHHMLAGGLSTNKPLDMTLRPVACTGTIIYDLVGKKIDEFPDNMKALIMSQILSDTLMFRSPTTTPHDKEVAEKLSQDLNINIKEYANEMFAAKSDVSDFSDSRIVLLDSKKIELGNKSIRVSVVETTTPETVVERKEGLKKAIEEIKKEENLKDILFFVIDIFNEEAIVITYNDFTKGVVEASFDVKVENDTEVLPGIVSRKKQIIPSLKLPV